MQDTVMYHCTACTELDWMASSPLHALICGGFAKLTENFLPGNFGGANRFLVRVAEAFPPYAILLCINVSRGGMFYGKHLPTHRLTLAGALERHQQFLTVFDLQM
jgi:hypothetical protein